MNIWKYTDDSGKAVQKYDFSESCSSSRQDIQEYLEAGGIIDQAMTPPEIEAREAETQANADRRADIIAKLSGLTDAQVDGYIDANVTNLAGAVAYLKRLTKVVRALAHETGVR